MKKRIKIGNTYMIFLYLYMGLIFLYIYITIAFYFSSLKVLSLLPVKPTLYYFIKWLYGILMIIGILRIKKNPNLCWLLLNSVSICVLLEWPQSFAYFVSIFDLFLLELVSLALIITINRKSFLRIYSIEGALKAIKELKNEK